MGAAPGGADLSPMMSVGADVMAEVPEAKKCIGQVVLDWEFLHDLDLHLLKVQQPGQPGGGSIGGYPAEPSPEPIPGPRVDLNSLVVTEATGQRLRREVVLQSIVSYSKKVHNPTRAHTPEAVLQVDRNAAVHSFKPVENMYLTETLEPGAYVIGVHNYSLRQLAENVIGPSSSHAYRTFDDFKKMDPGYQKMEKALNEQNAHAGDPDGTPAKQAIMARVDQEMNQGSQMIQSMCNSGTGTSGVHYGIAVYSYPEQWATAAKHPQMASMDEMQNLFQSGFFATADFVFDPDANTTGYNGANVVADVQSEQGKLALGNKKAAHVALLKVVKDPNSGKSKISEVIMLDGLPRADLGGQALGSPPSTMHAFRSQQMMQQNSSGRMGQLQEPFPEPHLQQTHQQMPMQMSQMPMQQPFPEPSSQQVQQQPFSWSTFQPMSQLPVQQPFPEPSLHHAQQQPFPGHAAQRVPMQLQQQMLVPPQQMLRR